MLSQDGCVARGLRGDELAELPNGGLGSRPLDVELAGGFRHRGESLEVQRHAGLGAGGPKAFFEERSLIPAGRLAETSFDALEANPLAEVERIYAELNLPAFSDVRPQVEAYVQSLAGYRKNKHRELPEELRERYGGIFRPLLGPWTFAAAIEAMDDQATRRLAETLTQFVQAAIRESTVGLKS